jgi:isoquinoline 1-oxidoreductase beta subunit
MGKIKNISRRGFIKSIGLASGGLILACNTEVFSPAKIAQGQFNPNLFVQLKEDGTLILVASRSEMGNGVRTSLTSVIADEMEADWNRVEVSQATGDKKYGDQNTDGSRSIRYLFETMREMGAMARTMLVQAAAIQWGLTEENCYAKKSRNTKQTKQ